MSQEMAIVIAVIAIPVVDWAMVWQVENAFAAFLRKNLTVPKIDLGRFAILFAIFLTVIALLLRIQPNVAGVVGIILVVAYFWRVIRTAKLATAKEH